MVEQHRTGSGSNCFSCLLDGDSVQCIKDGHGAPFAIPIKDIVCLFPSNDNHAHHYTMLFIRENPEISDATWDIQRINLKSAPPAILSSHLLTKAPRHLCHASNPTLQLHIIISSASGLGTASIISRCLQQLFSWVGVTKYKVHETESARTITDLCHSSFIPQAQAGVPQTIILVSGDGGLSDVIDSFHGSSRDLGTSPDIGLIPAGTGNALATSTGLAPHPTAALKALLRGKPHPLPGFVATFSSGARYISDGQAQPSITENSGQLRIYGGVVASWGIHAALVADSDTVEYRKFGADRFKMAAKELLYPADGSETHKYKGTITLTKMDEEGKHEYEEVVQQGEHMYLLGTMVSNLEKDFKISPESLPLDNSLRIVRFGPMPPQRAMELLSAAYQDGLHVQKEEVMYGEIEGFKINFHEVDGKWRRVCIDGKIVIVEENGWVNVQKKKKSLLNIVV
ncbi:ATP-NAD kinase-like domain-containing protein [Aspergillus venezuelensis]